MHLKTLLTSLFYTLTLLWLLIGCSSKEIETKTIQVQSMQEVRYTTSIKAERYRWRQRSGIKVTLLDADTSTLHFIAPKVEREEKLLFLLEAQTAFNTQREKIEVIVAPKRSEENNDTGTTIGASEHNTTLSPHTLRLTVVKTTLNKETNTTFTLTAAYENNTTKRVTKGITWLVTPKDAVTIRGDTLTALKDTNVTVQAKVGTTLSNKVNLHIYWEVNGHRLPPEPDPKVNNATLLGIDSNHNGVRDDVERWIYDRYKDSHPVMIPLKMQAARAYQKIIVDPSKAWETYHIMDDQMNCSDAFGSWANAFGRKPLFDKDSETEIKEMREMKYIQYNTAQRARAYGQYNQTLSGMVFRGEWPSEKWIENCDFNTTKYIEMSEKL